MKDSGEKEFLEAYLSSLEDRGEALSPDQPGESGALTPVSGHRDGALLHHQGVHLLPAMRSKVRPVGRRLRRFLQLVPDETHSPSEIRLVSLSICFDFFSSFYLKKKKVSLQIDFYHFPNVQDYLRSRQFREN